MVSYKDALAELKRTVQWLWNINESASRSLEEGLEETLTIHRLGVRGTLRRTLQSTNPIESAFDRVRRNSGRVKRWRNSSMVLRWIGSGLVQAESQFNRVKGFTAMQALVVALENGGLQEPSPA